MKKPANEKEARARALATSELENAASSACQALQRWMLSCTRAAGQDSLAITDVLVLHHIAHRHGAGRRADLRFALDIEDAHVLAYALRKLCARGLIAAERAGKEKTYALTEPGREHVRRYEHLREARLLARLQGIEADRLQELVRHLKTMSGLYDQAARAASSL